MNIPETFLKIIEDGNCPLYKKEDQFRLLGRSLTTPTGKATCVILSADIVEAVKTHHHTPGSAADPAPIKRFHCSGPWTSCTGFIRMEWRVGTPLPVTDLPQAEGEDPRRVEKIRSIIQVLAKFPIFEGLSQQQLQELGVLLKYRKAGAGEVVIRKGDPGVNLFIIASGKVEITGDKGIRIALLGKGEVFGEMSLISGQPVVATVTVVEPVRLLYIRGKDFSKILNRYPTLQMFFTRLLARRLAETNVAHIQAISSGMSGNLSDIPPSELFQTLNANQKTGLVDMNLSRGTAHTAFREGELVGAVYDGKTEADAFFAILKEKTGHFTFRSTLPEGLAQAPPLGDFMGLLMEGIRIIDEESGPA